MYVTIVSHLFVLERRQYFLYKTPGLFCCFKKKAFLNICFTIFVWYQKQDSLALTESKVKAIQEPQIPDPAKSFSCLGKVDN